MLNEQELIQKKTEELFKLSTIVHIKFKKGYWKRGMITEIGADFFILDETLEGLQPVFFQEIAKIEKFNFNPKKVSDGKL